MERRSFLTASIATACAAGAATAADGARPRDVYEIRTYALRPGKEAILDAYLRDAFLPAVKRLGSGPVGVFVDKEKEQTNYIVIVVHPSADAAAQLSERLAADAEHAKTAAAYLAAVATDPVYTRIESSLAVALDGMPKLARPDTSKPRMLNLRIYESHNERAGKKKIEMFNKAELAIFRRVGLTPVLFGETVLGSRMPNLTYMLVFPDEAGRKAAWDRFRGDPEWLALKAMPEYEDKKIVSHITNKLLTPTAYSEI